MFISNTAFGYDTLRKYTYAFGNLFNEIYIVNRDAPTSNTYFTEGPESDGAAIGKIKVPLSYGPKEKILARVAADPNIDRPSAVTLPWISFELQSIQYAPTRKLNSNMKFRVKGPTANTQDPVREMLSPVPYDLKFKVWVYAKYQVHGNQIIEQILPFFTPYFPLSIKVLPEMTNPLDAQVTLNSVNVTDTYRGEYIERRAIVWELDFTMNAYIFGPVRERKIIKFVDTKFYNATRFDTITDAVGNTPAIDRVTIQPGLLANGSPTTNVAASIPYQQINADDDWEYIVKIYGNLSEEE